MKHWPLPTSIIELSWKYTSFISVSTHSSGHGEDWVGYVG